MGGPVANREARIKVLGAKDAGLPLHSFDAVIDTGATSTAIKDSQAQTMGLRLLRTQVFNTANGPVVVPVYAMRIMVIGNRQHMVLQRTIEVAGATSLVGDMLYGMDMLAGGLFVMRLNGHGNGTWDWQEN